MILHNSVALDALLATRPAAAVIDLGATVFGLSASQLYRRVKAATKMAGLGEGFSAHSPRVGMAQDLSAAGRWDSPTMPAKYTAAQVWSAGPWPVPSRPCRPDLGSGAISMLRPPWTGPEAGWEWS